MNRVLDDRYELIEKIGEGGMATVYKARCRLLNRFVAIKVLKPDFVQDKKFLEGFNNESRAAASLVHPNIVSIYDVGVTEGLHYIVMELVEGKTLSSIIDEKDRLPEDETIKITQQIASALACAHKNGIIHRDVKPHNIIVSDNGTAKITDFGIAKAVSSTTIVKESDITGSVHYFSPEQARGGYVDGKSDIYSLGIVMYEMLTGRVPFDGDSPVAVAMMHIQKEMVPPSYYNPKISPWLEDVIMKATEKLQGNRFSDADELLKVLNQTSSSPEDYVIRGSIAGLPFGKKIEDMEQMDDPLLDPEGKKSDTIVLNKEKDLDDLVEKINAGYNSITGDSFRSMDDGDYSDKKPSSALEEGPGASIIEEFSFAVPAQVEAGDSIVISAPGADLNTDAGRRKFERIKRRDASLNKYVLPVIEEVPEEESAASEIIQSEGDRPFHEGGRYELRENPAADDEEYEDIAENEDLASSEDSPFYQVKNGDRAIKRDKDGNWSTTKPKKKIFTAPRALGAILGVILAFFVSMGILWVADFIKAPEVEMPNLLGMDYMEAKALLEGYNLEMEITAWEDSNTYEENQICSQDPDEGEMIREGMTVSVVVSKGLVENSVPDLVGMELDKARDLIEKRGYTLGTVSYEDSEEEEGIILSQSPGSGEFAKEGASIDLVVSNGETQKEIIMINVVGNSLESAKKMLSEADLIVGNVEKRYSEMYSKNTVMEQGVVAGSKVMTGTSITLVVSNGPDPAGTSSVSNKVPLVLDYSKASQEAFQLKVVMVKDGVVSTIYNECRYKSNDGESIVLEGSGQAELRIYFDGKMVSEGAMNFDTGEYTD